MFVLIKRKYYNLVSDQRFSQILTGSLFALFARIAAVGLATITSIIVARVYGAGALGILEMVNSFLMLSTIFTVLGTNSSILRLIPEHISKHSVTSAFHVYRKTQYLVIGVSFVTGTALFLASGIIADKVFSKPHLTFPFALASCFVVFKSLMDLNTQAVRGLQLIRTFALMQVLPATAMLVILMMGTSISQHPNNPVFSQLVAFGITAMVGAWIMDRAFKRRMHPDDAAQRMSTRDIVTLSTPMLLAATMAFAMVQSGVIVLGIFRPESEVGYYSIAAKLATLCAFIMQAINSMAAPKFSELYHSGRVDELFHVVRKSSKLIFWITAPVFLTLIILGRPVLGLLYGKDFHAAYSALIFLVIGQFVTSIAGSTSAFMNMTGHQRALRNILLISALINIVLSFMLIPYFGIVGAAFANAAGLVYWSISMLSHIKSKCGKFTGYVPYFVALRGNFGEIKKGA